jgi:murein DD-endopeptidase MepM/ murein hydrolase activator NlpD
MEKEKKDYGNRQRRDFMIRNHKKNGLFFLLVIGLILNFSSVVLAADYWSYPVSNFKLPQDGKPGGWKYWFVDKSGKVWGWHLGQDLCKDWKTEVKNARWGYVRHVDQHTSYGWVVVIESPRDYEKSTDPKTWNNPICHVYGHLRDDSYLDKTKKKIGQLIDKGVTIGRMGNKAENGGWDAIHVHFGMRKGRYESSGFVYNGYTTSQTVLNNWVKPSSIVDNY